MKKLLILLFLVLAWPAWAANYYVLPTHAGDYSGDSWANAMGEAEFEASIEGSAAAGDIYFVAGGTYTLDSGYSSSLDGTATAPIQIIGVDTGTSAEPPTSADWAVNDDRPLFICGATNVFDLDDYWAIKNIRTTTSDNPGLRVGAGGLLYNVKMTKTGSGWGIETNGSYTNILYCEVSNATGDAAIGITASDTVLVYGCYVHDSDTGIYLGRSNGTAAFNIVDTCTTGIKVVSYRNTVIYNTLYGADAETSVGILGTTAASGVYIGNIIQDFVTGVSWTTEQGTNFFDYNNYYSNTADVSNVTKGVNATAVDAGFTNASNGDFSIGENLKASGFPGAFPGGLSTGYLDIGAVQREEPAGGGGGGAVGYFSMD